MPDTNAELAALAEDVADLAGTVGLLRAALAEVGEHYVGSLISAEKAAARYPNLVQLWTNVAAEREPEPVPPTMVVRTGSRYAPVMVSGRKRI
jgi:hypothetical protein